VRLEAAKPGLTFHGLRHCHKTWMIADGVPEVAQSRRMGHILGDRIQETYSHVVAEVEHRLLEALNDRWDQAVVDSHANRRGVSEQETGCGPARRAVPRRRATRPLRRS
jgi:hypothetical protein